jgi:hemerythrin-like domain-containing protein
MKATRELSQEHKAIRQGLDLLRVAALTWKRNPLQTDKDCRALLGFLKTFADRCHHRKEEAVLFPKLTELGIPLEGGPLGVLLHEHEEARLLLRSMEQALDEQHPWDFVFHVDRYAELLQNHMGKEDDILFPHAETVLNAEDDAALAQRFNEIEKELGQETHKRFHALLARLTSRYRPAQARAS